MALPVPGARLRRSLTAPLLVLALLPGAALLPVGGSGGGTAAQASTGTSAGTSGREYRATITRTRHGIPHITADDWGSLGWGSGYATAETSTCDLLDTLVTARGQRSLHFGPTARYDDQVTLEASNLQVDALVTDLRNRKVVERLLRDPKAGPGPEARLMVTGYAAGVARYLRAHADDIRDPACRTAAYTRMQPTALDLWYGVYLANLLASTGVFAKEVVDAAPPTLTDPGLPQLPVKASAYTAAQRDALLKGLGKDPDAPFGSNATALGQNVTTTGRGMLLGNPHFPWRGRYRFNQQQLTIPGRYDVAGASLLGSPVVNIGWNKDVAWSHTVSTAYHFTPYEYPSLGGEAYVGPNGPATLERREVRIRVKQAGGRTGTVTEDLYRTGEGYVIDAPGQLMGWSPTSVWAIRDANAEHLRTIDSFLLMGRAGTVTDLLRRQDQGGGIPWVNTIAADRHGEVLYADHSVVPRVSNEMARLCMTPVGRVLDQVAGLPGLDGTRAGGDCAWGTDFDSRFPGVFGGAHLPKLIRTGWVANANDSYWAPNDKARLEGYPRIIGCEQCERTQRTKMVYRYVTDVVGADAQGFPVPRSRRISPARLASFEHANRVGAAEVMRAGGDLDAVCDATGETEACAALRRWDGRSNVDSRGNHLFEAFVSRLPDTGVWEVPFDARDPLGTPRDLNQANPLVVAAMQEAVDAVRAEGVAFDARWGSLQVSGDRGAPRIGLGGGDGGTGNANVLSSRTPLQNASAYKPVTYGSSHIQAVAFGDRGVSARTILTYGQSTDPTSPWSRDQTRLFAAQQWVTFPFTAGQIRADRISTLRLVGR